MVLSAAERSRRYREKLKSGNQHELLLRKEAARVAIYFVPAAAMLLAKLPKGRKISAQAMQRLRVRRKAEKFKA